MTPSEWKRYSPSGQVPWNLRRVVHLHRRAGFAATWSEIQRDLEDGPDASVERILTAKARRAGVPDDFARVARLLADAAIASRDPARLKAWWIYRMLFGPDPLGERLSLMWHNHFATSNVKVQDLAAMRRQNEIFREFGRASFRDLLPRSVKDPAMLVWLDAQANRKEHPNENLAREIMELFTLGVGNYAERDVKEAARALTGWAVMNNAFCEYDLYRDEGQKTIFGSTGRWHGDDFVRMLLEHPATSERLAGRIIELLMGEGVNESRSIAELAAGLREHELDIAWGVETVLRSEAFFSDRNIGCRVTGPIEFVIGSVRALELFDPPPSTLILAEWAATLGQDLFHPPNVFGWPGGRSWITTRSVIGRTNFATALVQGSLRSPASPLDGLGLAQKYAELRNPTQAIDFFSNLLLGRPATAELSDRIRDSMQARPGNDPGNIRQGIAILLASPDAQLG